MTVGGTGVSKGGGNAKSNQGNNKESDKDFERGVLRDVNESKINPVLWSYEHGREFLGKCTRILYKMGERGLGCYDEIPF